MTKSITFVCLILIAVGGRNLFAANIVTNGDFETGNLSGWTFNSASDVPWDITSIPGTTYDTPLAGSYSAWTGCEGSACVDSSNLSSASWLAQNLSTKAGDEYTLTFLMRASSSINGSFEPEDLKVLWGGSQVIDLCPAHIGCTNISDAPDAPQTYALTLTANSASTQLMFLGESIPAHIVLDNVDVEDVGPATPEPETFLLAGFSIFWLASFAHSRGPRMASRLRSPGASLH
jgi:hypothetical protein